MRNSFKCVALLMATGLLVSGCSLTAPQPTKSASHDELVDHAARAALPTAIQKSGKLRVGIDTTYAPNANQGASALSRGSLFISDISISISGTITQIANFTELLRTSKRYTQVSSVVMPDNGQSGGNTILVDLKVQIFMLKAK